MEYLCLLVRLSIRTQEKSDHLYNIYRQICLLSHQKTNQTSLGPCRPTSRPFGTVKDYPLTPLDPPALPLFYTFYLLVTNYCDASLLCIVYGRWSGFVDESI